MNSSPDQSADRQIDLFNQAKLLPTREQRERFVADACGADADLRAKVEELLSANDEAGSFLGKGVLGAANVREVTLFPRDLNRLTP